MSARAKRHQRREAKAARRRKRVAGRRGIQIGKVDVEAAERGLDAMMEPIRRQSRPREEAREAEARKKAKARRKWQGKPWPRPRRKPRPPRGRHGTGGTCPTPKR